MFAYGIEARSTLLSAQRERSGLLVAACSPPRLPAVQAAPRGASLSQPDGALGESILHRTLDTSPPLSRAHQHHGCSMESRPACPPGGETAGRTKGRIPRRQCGRGPAFRPLGSDRPQGSGPDAAQGADAHLVRFSPLRHQCSHNVIYAVVYRSHSLGCAHEQPGLDQAVENGEGRPLSVGFKVTQQILVTARVESTASEAE